MNSFLQVLPWDLLGMLMQYLIPIPAKLIMEPYPQPIEKFWDNWKAITMFTDIVRPGLEPLALLEGHLGPHLGGKFIPNCVSGWSMGIGSLNISGDPIKDYFSILVHCGLARQIIRALHELEEWVKAAPVELIILTASSHQEAIPRSQFYDWIFRSLKFTLRHNGSDEVLLYLAKRDHVKLKPDIFRQKRSLELVTYYYQRHGLIPLDYENQGYRLGSLCQVATNISINYFYRLLTHRSYYHPVNDLTVLHKSDYTSPVDQVVKDNILDFTCAMLKTDWEELVVRFYQRCFLYLTGCARRQKLIRAIRRLKRYYWVTQSMIDNFQQLLDDPEQFRLRK